MTDIWKPHVTVAAVIERGGKFLFVEENIQGKLVINQPAGHLEQGESLIDAVVRETLEETGWSISADELVGIYRLPAAEKGRTYLRFCFTGECLSHDPLRKLDEGIQGTVWLNRGELQEKRTRLRSTLVLRSIEDYLAGQRYPLSILKEL